VDYGDFLNQAAALDASFSSLASSAATALAGAVLYKKGGAAEANARGLTLYFPPTSANYQQSTYAAFTGAADWRSFLETFYTAGASTTVPLFAASSSLSVTRDASSNLVAVATLDAATASSIATATLYTGFSFAESSPGVGDDQVLLMGEQPAGFNASNAWSTWDRSLLVMSDGTSGSWGYLSLTLQGSLWVATIPLAYLPPGAADCSAATVRFAQRVVVFDGTGAIQQDTLFADDQGAQSVLAPVAGSHLVSLAYAMIGSKELTQAAANSGWYCMGAQLVASPLPAISVSLADTSSGPLRYAVALAIANAGGNGATLAAFGGY
jgi:hypothetical protein